MTVQMNLEGLSVGFEFEFAVPDISKIFPETQESISVWPLSSLVPNEFANAFNMDDKTAKRFRALARAAYRSEHKSDYYAIDDIWHETRAVLDPVFLSIILGLIPRRGWMKSTPLRDYEDVTHKACGMINSYHQGIISFDEVYEYFHDMYIEIREDVFLLEFKDSVLDILSVDFSDIMGVEVEPYKGDCVKTYNTWTLETEYLEDINDIEGEPSDGFELVSPIFNEHEAPLMMNRACEALRILEQKYGLKTTKGCGLHINISDGNALVHNMSFLHAALRDEPLEFSKMFRRTHNESCKPLIHEVRRAITELARDNIISTSTLRTKRGVLLTTQLVESLVPGLKSDSFRIASKLDKKYIEYRFAGNKNYHRNITKLDDYLAKLFEFHRSLVSYEQASRDEQYADNLIKMIENCNKSAFLDDPTCSPLSDIRDIVNP